MALLTVWLSDADVLPANLVSPPYTAVMESVPPGKSVVVKLAVPPLSVSERSVVVPCMNQTVSPLGIAPAVDETLAVKVTGSP